MNNQDLIQTALQTAEMVEKMGRMATSYTEQIHHAVHRLENTHQHASHRIEHHVQQGLHTLETATQDALKSGLQPALRQAQQALQQSTDQLQAATAQLAQHLKAAEQTHTLNGWKVLVGSALAILAAIFFITFAYFYGNTQIKRADWINSINQAIDKGTLVAYENNGICAIQGKTQYRLN